MSTSDATAASDQFYEFLKESAATPPETDEDKNTVGVNAVAPGPEGDGGCIDSSWGEPGPQAGGRNQANQHGDVAVATAHEERAGILQKLFSGTEAAATADQALLSANFEHFAQGDFTARSALLGSKMKTKTAAPTLLESVVRIVGRS